MSQEVQYASINVARSMEIDIVINGALASGVAPALLFCDLNIDSVSNDQFPAVAILAQAM